MGRAGFIIESFLDAIDLDIPLLPLESVHHWMKRKSCKNISHKSYRETIWKLQHKNYLEIVEKNNKKFLKLTEKGQLEKLLRKARIPRQSEWDGKWRVLMFDIPEKHREKRDFFRYLLKQNNYAMLQASVFINPYPLNPEALKYLKKIGLMEFVRYMEVFMLDSDKDLMKKFGVSK